MRARACVKLQAHKEVKTSRHHQNIIVLKAANMTKENQLWLHRAY